MDLKNEKQAVAFYSILAAVGMIAGKVTVGLITGSLAIISDAIHSLLDMTASIITYFAVRISDKPADYEHHFGHGKVESLAALTQVTLLMGTCLFIVYKAVEKLQGGGTQVELNVWAFVVMIGSILIDVTRVRALKRTAVKYSSQALAADALNFSTDIFASIVVLIGLAAISLGVSWADPLAAIIVALFIASAVLRMGKRAVDVLIDRAPVETVDEIRHVIRNFPEIVDIDRVRLRSDGRMVFADLSLHIDRSVSFARVAELKNQLKHEFDHHLPLADVTFSFTPTARESEQVTDAIRYVVSSFGYPLHHLIVNEEREGYFVSMHVEMPGDISLDEAHRKTKEITNKLHESVDRLKKVVIHTEPFVEETPSEPFHIKDLDHLAARIKEIIESFEGVEDCHDIVLTPHANGVALSADMRLVGSLPLDQTHFIADEVEKKLRMDIPELASITLHLEPMK